MKTLHSISLVAALVLGGTGAALADGPLPPTFERDGFPITLHQAQTSGSDRVHEQVPASTLTREGMPASPHQLSVLRPNAEATR